MIPLTAKRGKSFLAATLNGLEDEYSPCNSVDKEDRDVPTTIVAKRKMLTLSGQVKKKETIMTPEFSLGTAHSSSHWRKQSCSLSTSSTISSKHSDRDSIGSSEEDGERIDENDSLKQCSRTLFPCSNCHFDSQDSRNDALRRCNTTKEECSNRQEGVSYFTSPWDFQSPIQLQPDNFHLMKTSRNSNIFPSSQYELKGQSKSHIPTNRIQSNFQTRNGTHVNQVPTFIPFWYQQNFSPQPMVMHHYYQNPFYGAAYPSCQNSYLHPHNFRIYAPRWN